MSDHTIMVIWVTKTFFEQLFYVSLSLLYLVRICLILIVFVLYFVHPCMKCSLDMSNFLFFPILLFSSIFLNFYFYFILLYNTVLVLPYIDMNPPRVCMSSQSWTPLPPPTPYHLSGSSPCTSPKHPVSCIEHRLAIHFLHDSIHVSMPLSQIISPLPLPQSPKVCSTYVSL